MLENTSLSTNQSPTEGDIPSKENLPTQKVGGLNLSAIPLLKPTSLTPTSSHTEQSTSLTAPPSFDDGKLEYEFTNLWEGCLYCVHLYDTDDVSACERVLNRPVKPEEISYSNTGNGFILDDEFKYTFQKSPFQRTFTNIQVKVAPPTKADDILAQL